MERLFLVCSLLLLGGARAQAADYLNGDWFIITGRNTVVTSDPTGDVAKAMAAQKELKCLAFTGHGDWSFLIGGNGILHGGGIPSSLGNKIPELWKVTSDFKCLAFRPQGGWVLLHDKNGFAEDGIAASTRAELQQLHNAGGTFRSIAFTPDGGWVLLLEKGFREEGLPRSLSEKLAEHAKQGIAIRCVAFTSEGDWFLLDDRNNFFSSNPNHPAYKKLTDLKEKGQVLQWIAFAPGEYTHGYVLLNQPVQRIRAVMTTNFSRPSGGVNQWVVMPAQAPELPRQRDIKFTLEPDPIRVLDDGLLKEKVLLSRVHDKPKGFLARATYEMTLYTNVLIPRLAGQAAPRDHLSPVEHAAYTHVTDDMKTRVFQNFLDKTGLRRKPKESEMTFARRTFLHIAKHFSYLYPNLEGIDVAQSGRGDCGGLSWVFVRTMCSSGIPARLILGRWATSEEPAKGGKPPNGQFHCKPEVFIDNLGWVGADMSGGVGVEGNPFVCFGTETGDFVVLDFDVERVVVVRPGDKPEKLGGTQGVFWWYWGADGKGPQTQDHWTVQVLLRHPHASPFKQRFMPPPTGPHDLQGSGKK